MVSFFLSQELDANEAVVAQTGWKYNCSTCKGANKQLWLSRMYLLKLNSG